MSKSTEQNRCFTLIELLVVIAVIGILAGMLLPALAASRQKAQKIACASLLKQYALATEYYTIDWKGYFPDVQTYLQKESGFLAYFGDGKEIIPQQIARCPGDGKTEELGRLGQCTQGSVSVKVSIGVNGNNISDTQSGRSTGAVAYWVRKDDPLIRHVTPSKISMWMDYQFQATAAGEALPVTGAIMKSATAASLNKYAFRHSSTMNSTFQDGHVGEIRLNLPTMNYGHDFVPGIQWTVKPSHVLLPFGARPVNASMYPSGFPESTDVTVR